MQDNKSLPSVYANKDGFIICPYCFGMHRHGGQGNGTASGHRAADCGKGEYNVIPFGTMKINNIILIQRDGKAEYKLCELYENGLCRLEGITTSAIVCLSLFHIMNALNTPNGAWSLKMPEGTKFIYDSEVWIKGKMLSENGREEPLNPGYVEDIIGIDEVGHERQLSIRRRNQIRKRILQ